MTNISIPRSVTSTKQYRALLAAFDGDRETAYEAYQAVNAPAEKPEVTPDTTVSLEKTPKQKKAKKDKAQKVEKIVTTKDTVEALVEARGFGFARGRVYVTGEIVEASVRVLKGGSPEIVKTSGNGRISAVAIFATESGDCAVQNLVNA